MVEVPGVNLDGNGRVVNHGVISGQYNSQLAEGDGDGGAAFSATYIANSGTIVGGGGNNLLLLTGTEGGSFSSVNQFQQWQVQQGSWQMAADMLIASDELLQIDALAQLYVQGMPNLMVNYC